MATSSYYPEGSMKGSGIDSGEFEYGTFTCENDDCKKENIDAIAQYDDWGAWSVECEFCGDMYTSGYAEDRFDDGADDDWHNR
jgi:hypothetical protein